MKKKVVAIIIAVVLVGGAAGIFAGKYLFKKALTTSGLVKPRLETMDLNWDLKADKEVPYTTVVAGINEKIHGTAKITNWKITDADKEGYKKLTFRATFKDEDWKPSEKQVTSIISSSYATKYGQVGDYRTYSILDYQTGECLLQQNDKKVVAVTNPVKTEMKKFKGNNGAWIGLNDVVMDFVIIYPKDYKDMCILLGGASSLEQYKDYNPSKGLQIMDNTKYYSEKENYHFLRVSE